MRMILGLAGAALVGLVLAGCASPSPSGTTVPTPTAATSANPTSIVASFPATIGQWHLVATVQPIDSAGPTAAVITAAGGTPATATAVNVQVSGGSDKLAFDALRVPGVTLDAFARATEPRIAALGTTERSEITVAGWRVVRYATPADYDPPKVLYYTSRGDLIYIFGGWSIKQLAPLLAGLP